MASPPFTIRANNRKAFKFFAFFTALAIGCAWQLGNRRAETMWLSSAFFAIVAAQNLAVLLARPRLTVDDGGLHWSGVRSWSIAWSEIGRFRLVPLRRSSHIVIDYRDDAAPADWKRLVRPKIIPKILWIPADEMLELLQARLDAARISDLNPAVLRMPAYELLETLKVQRDDAHTMRSKPAMLDQSEALAQPVAVVPWLSIGLIVVLILVFTAEIRFPVTPPTAPMQPSVATLIGFGGLGWNLLADAGQWYRFASAPFLHVSQAHLFGNCFALFLAGRLLEGVIGRTWFAAIYMTGALAGAAVSLLMNDANLVSVGASGAILALFAAACVCSFHFAHSAGRYRLQSGAGSILLPTLLSMGGTVDGMRIDFGDHLGGAIGGVLMGLVLLWGWAPQAGRPPRRRSITVLAGLGALAYATAIWPAVSQHGVALAYGRVRANLDNGQLDQSLSDATRLVQIAPSDPDAWQLLGDIQFARTKLQEAIVAFDKAEDLKLSADSERARGLARFYAGDQTGALADLDAAARLEPKYLYGRIWLALIRSREGYKPGPAPDDLAGTDSDWPAPILRLFRGTADPAAVLAAAQADKSQTGKGRLCEAGFYIAEWYLLHGQEADAESGFPKAVQDCPPDFTETWMAKAELARSTVKSP